MIALSIFTIDYKTLNLTHNQRSADYTMTINRRHFLKGVGLISLAPSSTLSTDITERTNQQVDFAFACPPYLQNLSQNSVTIGAVFNAPCFARVELLDETNKVTNTIYQVEDGMRNSNSQNFLFRVPVAELRAIRYRVVAKEVLKFEAYDIQYGATVQSEIIQAPLARENQEEIHCLVLNDIHEHVASYSELIAKSQLPSTDLLFLNGDSFHYVSSEADLTEKLLKPLGQVLAGQTPYVMVRGNHETRGNFARQYKRYFDYPEGKFYHSFKLGPVYWIVLDSGEDKPDTHEVYAGTVDYDSYRLEQRAWLQRKLQSTERKSAAHTIVVTHIPFHHSDDWHGTAHNYDCFHDVLQAHQVDAVLSGHTHQYAFHKPNAQHNYYVIIGGAPKVGDRTYVDIHASADKLQVTLQHEDGHPIGELLKTKS
ncbi:MAG: metallophosphoesterase family protein [Sphingobacterium sp.]